MFHNTKKREKGNWEKKEAGERTDLWKQEKERDYKPNWKGKKGGGGGGF